MDFKNMTCWEFTALVRHVEGMNKKLVALAAVGAEVVGVDMTEELKKPIVVDRPAQGAPAQEGKREAAV